MVCRMTVNAVEEKNRTTTEERRPKAAWILPLYLAFYSLISGSFLTRFPYVHSDEAWLYGLTKDMMAAGSLGVTESCFQAKPRYPHAIKAFFHLLEELFVTLFGGSVFSMRLMSLAAAVIFLVVFYLIIKKWSGSSAIGIMLTVLISLEPQFIYASHFARQEIWILLLFAASTYVIAFAPGRGRPVAAACFAAVITGISIGFHPNSFLIACSMGGILLFFLFLENAAAGLRAGAAYVGLTGFAALIFVAVSTSFRSGFLKNYFSYGAEDFGLDAPAPERLTGLFGFFGRLFRRESGTYYLTDNRAQMVIFLLLAAVTVFLAAKLGRVRILMPLSGAIGLTAGIFAIGRFNQLSIIFYYLFGYMMLSGVLAEIQRVGPSRAAIWGVFAAGAVFLALSSFSHIRPWLHVSTYDDYIGKLSELVPPGAKTLGNLGMEFYFDQGMLLDVRDLPYAVKSGGVKKYLEENGVEYIIYPSELDYIYDRRPYFNVIYGNIMFLDELREIVGSCEHAGSFSDPVYGSRINALADDPEYSKVDVYRVQNALK